MCIHVVMSPHTLLSLFNMKDRNSITWYRCECLLFRRRYVYHNVVKQSDISRLIDVGGVQVWEGRERAWGQSIFGLDPIGDLCLARGSQVSFPSWRPVKCFSLPSPSPPRFLQPYVINNARVVFLNHRPQVKLARSVPLPAAASPNACLGCTRSLQEPFRFCSIACKADVAAYGPGVTGPDASECLEAAGPLKPRLGSLSPPMCGLCGPSSSGLEGESDHMLGPATPAVTPAGSVGSHDVAAAGGAAGGDHPVTSSRAREAAHPAGAPLGWPLDAAAATALLSRKRAHPGPSDQPTPQWGSPRWAGASHKLCASALQHAAFLSKRRRKASVPHRAPVC